MRRPRAFAHYLSPGPRSGFSLRGSTSGTDRAGITVVSIQVAPHTSDGRMIRARGHPTEHAASRVHVIREMPVMRATRLTQSAAPFKGRA
jgi:hypothetical protein